MVDEQKQETALQEKPVSQGKPKGRPPSDVPTFPRNSLNDALRVAKAIRKENQGDPFNPIQLANALGTTRRSSPYYELLRSSERYGLTKGTVYSSAISLQPLAQTIVVPIDDASLRASLRTALLTPKLFNDWYTSTDKKPIPREAYFKNGLETKYGVRKSDIDSCFDVLWKNINELGLILKQGQEDLLWLDNLGKVKPSEELKAKEPVPSGEAGLGEQAAREQEAHSLEVAAQLPKQIFVAHGKNKKPLEQLERILLKFKTVKYKVATEEPNRGLPVSGKVAELMKECTSGIFIFTADEETTDAKGNTVWRPSDNVVYELGAASVLYGRKIVIFKEEDVAFASDFSDIGYIPFEKDKLDAKTADLMLELINLGFMQLTPT